MAASTPQGRERPLSPHLSIYRWHLSMALSILHRATGVALSVGALLLAWWLIAGATSPEAFATVQAFIGSPVGVALMLGWTFSLYLHLASGVRHLVWDAGYGFDLRSAYVGGWIVVLSAIALTALTWIGGLMTAGA